MVYFRILTVNLTKFLRTESMIPGWFSPEAIPYTKMFDDDIHWIPLFLGAKKFAGRVDFDKAGEGQDVGKILRWWFGTYE